MTSISKAQRPVKWITVANLDVAWVQSQRPLNSRKVAAIRDNLDPDAIGVITVSPNGSHNGTEKFHIIDGQHRVVAVREAWGPTQQVQCQVITEAATPEEAAEIWLVMNTERSTPSSFERFGVAITAGRELETSVNEIIKSSPFKLGKGGITAVTACMRVYQGQGAQSLIWVLAVVDQMWGNQKESVQAAIIEGMSIFLKRYRTDDGKNFKDKQLIKKVSGRYTAVNLVGSARASREMFGGSLGNNVSSVMATVYNKKVRDPDNRLEVR
jgi:hypothetical protein